MLKEIRIEKVYDFENGQSVYYESYTNRYFRSNDDKVKESIELARINNTITPSYHIPRLYNYLGLREIPCLEGYCDKVIFC